MLNTSSVAAGFGRHGVCPTFDHLTLKLLCKSHLRWGTFLPNLGTLGLWVLELFAMYATDERTKATLIAPFLYGGDGIIMGRTCRKCVQIVV